MFSIDKNYLLLKGSIVFLYLLVSIFGIVNIYSASNGIDGVVMYYFYKQITFLSIGVFIVIFIGFYGISFLYKISYLSIVATIFLLLLSKAIGTGRGTTRWINLGFFYLQPSEVAKISLILVLSKYFSDIENITWKKWIPPFV
jgi:rod shape determining protein RodA